MPKRQQRPEKPKRKRKKTSGIGVFPPDEALLKADETCNVLKISRRTLWSWSNGRHPILPPVKIGGLPRWTVADVQRLIRERKIAA
jgi:predicted DNA-binding transcriptional regulator AlpA